MNIFATNICPIQSAKEHNNVHLVKMILESAQLLSTAHYVLDGEQVGYKPTHRNHPCAIWVRQCSGNYLWLYTHFQALCAEYTFRTNKVHKSSALISALATPPWNIVNSNLTPFAMAMPEQYQKLGILDQTKAYQAYLNDKFDEWRSRAKPMKVEWGVRDKPVWLNS